MSEQHAPTGGRHAPGRYEIRVQGRLEARWAAWFDGLSLTHAGDGTTVIQGPVADQAALHSLLQKVRDLGLPLIAVTRVDGKPANGPDGGPDGDHRSADRAIKKSKEIT
jgi:hypothetical protein